MTNILIIGGGGREHALAWKIAQSPRAEKIYVAPGNGGTAQTAENVPIAANDIAGLAAFAKKKAIALTVVGMDDPLALGVVDEFRKAGLLIFGPTKAADEIESSKVFAKQLMKEEGIPTADFETFADYDAASRYLNSKTAPIVVKASGLALGKGAIVCATLEEAHAAIKSIMVDRAFGDAGNEIVIEEFLEGQEISIEVFSDGKTWKMMPTAQDHKQIGEGDTGPNTGGIGTIAPVPWVTPDMLKTISDTIVEPALRGMAKRGRPFTGCFYPGLKMTPHGPKVLEFNARFGDPEPQSVLRLLKTDFLDILEACAEGTLDSLQIEWHQGYAACVVLVSGGYPNKYEKGKKITGIEEAKKITGVEIFHAGTVYENGAYYTSGGRVLGITAKSETLRGALDLAYEAAAKIHFDGMHYRKDIGAKAL